MVGWLGGDGEGSFWELMVLNTIVVIIGRFWHILTSSKNLGHEVKVTVTRGGDQGHGSRVKIIGHGHGQGQKI